MSLGDWLSSPENWVFFFLAVTMLITASRVVTTTNIVHAVLYLVVTLAITAMFFLLLGAEFVAWTVVLISIGAVVVLFLFGIMITKSPMGEEKSLSHPTKVKIPAAIISVLLFVVIGGSTVAAFGFDAEIQPGITRTADIGGSIFQRWVIPFEVVSVLLLAALIGSIVLARRDPGDFDESPEAYKDRAEFSIGPPPSLSGDPAVSEEASSEEATSSEEPVSP